MQQIRNVILLSIIAIIATGCGSSPILLKKEDKQNIKKIALIKIEEPAYSMISKGSAGAAFGAVGGAVVGAEAESLTGKLNAVIKKQNYMLSSVLEKSLTSMLTKSGYSVHLVKIKRQEKGKLFENFQAIKYQKADAILDVVIEYAGYSTEHFMFSSHWRPDVKVTLGLGKPGDDKLIYSETFMYGYHNPFMTGTDLDADKKYHFDEEEQVFKAGDQVIVNGLTDAANAIAKEIGNRLQK